MYVCIVEQMFRDYFGPVYGKYGYNIGVMLSTPKSRGTVTLRSRNPRDTPLIDPNFLSNPEDVDTMVAGERVWGWWVRGGGKEMCEGMIFLNGRGTNQIENYNL